MAVPGGFPEIIIDEQSGVPKYVQLAKSLEVLIRQGTLAPDTKLPSENELFDRLSLSRSTIRNALSILERKNLVIRRQGNGTFTTGSLPTRAAPSGGTVAGEPAADPRPGPDSRNWTASGKAQRIIGLIVPTMKNTIYPDIVRGVEDCAHSHGYTVFIGNTYTDQTREQTLIEQMLHSGIDGLLIDPTHSLVEQPDFPSYPFLAECPVPVVLLNNYIGGLSIPMVAPDDVRCGQLAADYFYQRGHRHVAFIYKGSVAAAVNRRDGFVGRCRTLGIAPDPAKIIDYPEEDENDQPGYRLTVSLLGMPTPPSAIFYFNDVIAIQGMNAIRDAGLTVGRDVSVMGFDNIAESNDPDIQLTTFEHPKHFCGEWAADILFSKINHASAPHTVLIQPDLIERSSVMDLSR
jgi:GntR family transcriptional regulator of arabinose operon